MENVINQIILIDKQACTKLENAKAQKNQIIQRALAEAEEIKSHSAEDAGNIIKEKEDEYRIEFEKALADINQNKLKEMHAMDEEFNQRHSEVETAIFNAIIGV